MDLREHMKNLIRDRRFNCIDGFDCSICPFGVVVGYSICYDHDRRFVAAQKWLDDHPETPTAPPTITDVRKSATLGDASYSVDIYNERITVYQWFAGDYTSVSFPGAVADLAHFDETDPATWFAVAAKIITGRI